MNLGREHSSKPSEPAAGERQRGEKHRRVILCAWTLLLMCLLALITEFTLRLAIGYRIDYYTGTVINRHLIRFPFGDVAFNAFGYPDREWDVADPRPHVGFWGDSITSGIGAGLGYRYTDLISTQRPDHYYMNFGGPGEDGIVDDTAIAKVVAACERFGLRKLVYAMDLNDILPDPDASNPGHSGRYRAALLWRRWLDGLRDRSYLYNYLRTKLTVAARRLGYGYHGDEAFELSPMRNAVVIRQTVTRINRLAASLRQRDVDLCVLLFPYEMQVSDEAALRYRQDGVRWSAELLQGEPQAMILAQLSPAVTAVDLAPAFRQRGNAVAPRVGEYFVFNQGDALDWIHPNRNGHRLIAQYLLSDTSSCL